MNFGNSRRLQTESVWRAEWERVICPFFPRNKCVLDCGCGPAYYRDLFGNNYVGVDIQRCFPKRGIYVRASVMDLPFRETSFEFMLVSALFEHIENPNKALSEVCRVLKRGGCLVLSTPSRYGAKYETLKTFRGYNVEDLERLAHDQKLLIKRRFKVGGAFAIIFAQIENIFRRKLKVVNPELPSFEGERYSNLLRRSHFGKMILKLRETILRLVIMMDMRIHFKASYQGACIFAVKCNADG